MTTTPAFPAAVYLIRHGEKVGDPADDGDGGPDLSIRGSARAAALPSLFTAASCAVAAGAAATFTGTYASSTSVAQPRFATPQRLIATKTSAHSNRPIETISALAQALALPIHAGHDDEDYAHVAHAITSKPETYGGLVVLIAWHHGKLPDLALALGVPAEQVTAALGGAAKWPGDVFDWIWQITWDPTGAATLTPGFQQLLFGDATRA